MNRAWIVLAGLVVSSCGDAAIGEEGCVGVTCEQRKSFQPELLIVDFKEVSTLGAAELPIAWKIPNLCGTPCAEAPQLYAASDGAVWNLPRNQPLPAPELVQADGSRTTQLVNPPSELTSLSRLSLVGAGDGRLIGHAEWVLPTGVPASEMLVFGANASLQRYPLTGVVRSRLPPAAIPSEGGGYLFYDDGVERGDPPFAHNVVRNVYGDGSTAWQQGAFPSVAEIVAGSAVHSMGGVVIPAHSLPRGSARARYGILWLTPSGEIERLSMVSDASWRGMRLLDFGRDRFVMAAASDLLPANGTTGDTTMGNIDIISFESSRVSRGFRLMRDCFYPLALNGVAADDEGTLYVSSVVGLRDQPRGLLCRLPVDGTPRCFQSDPMHALTAIVAIAPNVLIGALDDELIRIDLP